MEQTSKSSNQRLAVLTVSNINCKQSINQFSLHGAVGQAIRSAFGDSLELRDLRLAYLQHILFVQCDQPFLLQLMAKQLADMTETCHVLSMLNAQASRQMKNEQLEAAKRTVDEAMRYYNESVQRRQGTTSSSSPHKIDLMVLCQARVSILLKVKIGRLEVALGSQTKNDRLVQTGNKTMALCTRNLQKLLKESNQ